jgi:hypothetical protein
VDIAQHEWCEAKLSYAGCVAFNPSI